MEKRGIIILFLILVLSSYSYAAVVSHQAEQIRAGTFGEVYTGNWAFMNGSLGVGTKTPGYTLDVNGVSRMTGFMMPTDAQSGYVLASDGSGNGNLECPLR